MVTVRIRRDPTLRERARLMRAQATHAETHLWNALRAHRLGGWKWRRQVPKGRYIVDFVCDEGALAVEVDGGQHSEQLAYDTRRTAFLAGAGLQVLRFWNSQVLENRSGVCLTILDALGGDRPGWDPLLPLTPLRSAARPSG
jgi:very-short-patch-repair endonuclease